MAEIVYLLLMNHSFFNLYLQSSSGTSNLFNLVNVLKNEEIEFSKYKTGVIHRKHLVKLTTVSFTFFK